MGVGYDVAALGQGVPPMADYNIENLKFLFVDDNANMRHLMSTILSSLGPRIRRRWIRSIRDSGNFMISTPISSFATLEWSPWTA